MWVCSWHGSGGFIKREGRARDNEVSIGHVSVLFSTSLGFLVWFVWTPEPDSRYWFLSIWKQILVCRLIDRPVRPLIANGFNHETQILVWVSSYNTTILSLFVDAMQVYGSDLVTFFILCCHWTKVPIIDLGSLYCKKTENVILTRCMWLWGHRC
jgi:hypothetical protein